MSKITVGSVEPAVWPDTCLGLHATDWEKLAFKAMTPAWQCPAASVPGLKVALNLSGENYVYHADFDGHVLPRNAFAMAQADPVWVEFAQGDSTHSQCDIVNIYGDRASLQDLCAKTYRPYVALPTKMARDLYRLSITSGPFVERLDRDISVSFHGVGFEENSQEARELVRDLAQWILAPAGSRQCTYVNVAGQYLLHYPCYWALEESGTGTPVSIYTPAHRVSWSTPFTKVDVSIVSEVKDNTLLALMNIEKRITGSFNAVQKTEVDLAGYRAIRLAYQNESRVDFVVYLFATNSTAYAVQGSGDLQSADNIILSLAFPGSLVKQDVWPAGIR